MMHKKSAGFSLPEVILIVAVLAIISGMAFPDMASFFSRQRLEQERTELEQIKKAMEVYARQCGKLPAETNNPANCLTGDAGTLTWYQALASVSNMSADEIRTDTWGVPRRYTHADKAASFLGGSGSMTFDYASVRSNGPNRCNDTNGNTATCPHFDGGYSASAVDWNLDGTSGSPSYSTFTPAADDMAIKFTDNQIKAAAYEETLRRLERVIAALDRYAQAKFNEAIVFGTDECAGSRIYYPPSSANGWSGSTFGNQPKDANDNLCGPLLGGGTTWNYSAAHASDVDPLYTDNGDDEQRKENMQDLMRLLGLPLDHCCSALTNKAFYYYSSPGVSDGGSCRYSIAPPYFPPKVTVEADDCP